MRGSAGLPRHTTRNLGTHAGGVVGGSVPPLRRAGARRSTVHYLKTAAVAFVVVVALTKLGWIAPGKNTPAALS